MPYDYFTPVEQPNVLAQIAQLTQLQGVMDSRRKKAQLAQFLQTGDVNSVEGLRQAYQIDPDFGIKLSKMQGQQGSEKNKMAKMAADMEKTQTETKQMKAKVLAGVAGLTVKQFDALPPEQQTPENYANLYRNSRTGVLQIGMHSPDEIPEFMPLEELRAVQGGNFSPSQQATAELGQQTFKQRGDYQQQQQGLRERQFAQQTGIENQRLGIEGARLNLSKQSAGQEQAARVAAVQRADASAAQTKDFRTKQLELQGRKLDMANQPKPLTPAVAQKIRDKLQAASLIRTQLEKVKSAFSGAVDPVTGAKSEGIEGTFSAGPGGGYVPTQKGQAFDVAVAGLAPFFRQISRTPGEGAMSDYETKLAQAALPSRGQYEQNTQAQIQQIEDIVNQIESGYGAMLNPSGAPQGPAGPARQLPKIPVGSPGAGQPPGAGGEHPQDMFQRLMTGGR